MLLSVLDSDQRTARSDQKKLSLTHRQQSYDTVRAILLFINDNDKVSTKMSFLAFIPKT